MGLPTKKNKNTANNSTQAKQKLIQQINTLKSRISELTEEIKQKTGFNLKFTVKDMDIDYLENIKDIEIGLSKRVETDMDAAEIILSTIKDNFKCCYVSKSYQLYYKYSNIWTDDIEFIKNKLALLIMNFGLYKVKRTKTKYGEEVENKDFGRDLVEINHIVDCVIKIARDNIDNNFYNKLHTTTKGKLCFQDGVLDAFEKKMTMLINLTMFSFFILLNALLIYFAISYS
jgi:hypothetical protein